MLLPAYLHKHVFAAREEKILSMAGLELYNSINKTCISEAIQTKYLRYLNRKKRKMYIKMKHASLLFIFNGCFAIWYSFSCICSVFVNSFKDNSVNTKWTYSLHDCYKRSEKLFAGFAIATEVKVFYQVFSARFLCLYYLLN